MPLDATNPPLFSCPDWWEKIQRGETPIADVPINEERAAKALAFFNRLRLPDVKGNPPLSEACGDWFRDVLVAFLASEDPETKERLVWELLCLVPKKSSKSTYSAALAITALYMEETPNGQMLLIGPSQNISARCFDQAQAMIRLDEDLDAIFHVTDNTKSIKRRKTGTELQVKTFDTGIITLATRMTSANANHKPGPSIARVAESSAPRRSRAGSKREARRPVRGRGPRPR